MIQTRKEANLPTALMMAFTLAAMFICPTAPAAKSATHNAATANNPDRLSWDFEDVPIGKLPVGWKVEATNQNSSLASWQVIEDASSAPGDHVLAMTNPNHSFGSNFNICWTNKVSFVDGEIAVRFKAVKGEEDQGGGVIWRVQDKDNYYIARFNPLEDNLRLYSVHDGTRKTLADARITLTAGPWHTLRIVQDGARFTGYLDGKKRLEGRDNLFAKAGGVGLWTKADAVTSFDDFSLTPSSTTNKAH